jgi:hypothetical protein
MAVTPFGAPGAVGDAPGTVVATVVVTVVATVLVVAALSEPPFPDPLGWAATVDCFGPVTPPVFVDPDCGVARAADGPPAPFSVTSPPDCTFPELFGTSM